MTVEIPSYAVADSQAGAGELWQVVLAIAGPESGWNPGAEGDCKLYRGGPLVPCGTPGATPYSFGYLQFYTDGGLGDGHSPATLKDGTTNMRLGAEYIRSRLGQGASLYAALSPWSTRDAAWALYQRIQAEGIAGVDAPAPAGSGGQPNDKTGLVVALVLLGVLIALS